MPSKLLSYEKWGSIHNRKTTISGSLPNIFLKLEGVAKAGLNKHSNAKRMFKAYRQLIEEEYRDRKMLADETTHKAQVGPVFFMKLCFVFIVWDLFCFHGSLMMHHLYDCILFWPVIMIAKADCQFLSA